ncbi:hypothetical protein LCGC14_1219440 [marine sediment metagenome]|uniref:Uncharacterized protein n=1 Tax=marine sediment metagenome TaxID=412755 RepID=A0A0F9NU28_9ZZZZ
MPRRTQLSILPVLFFGKPQKAVGPVWGMAARGRAP